MRAKAIQSQTEAGREEVMGRKKLAARLSEVSQTISPPAIWHSLPLLAAQVGQQRLHGPSGSLSFPPRPLLHLPISSSPLSLSPQSAQLSSWLFTLYEVLTVSGSFTNSFTSFTNVLFGNLGQEAQGREPDHFQSLQQRRIYK